MSSMWELLPSVETVHLIMYLQDSPLHTCTTVAMQESESIHCYHRHKEWTEAEHKHLSQSLQITKSVGILYYAHVKVCGRWLRSCLLTSSKS